MDKRAAVTTFLGYIVLNIGFWSDKPILFHAVKIICFGLILLLIYYFTNRKKKKQDKE